MCASRKGMCVLDVLTKGYTQKEKKSSVVLLRTKNELISFFFFFVWLSEMFWVPINEALSYKKRLVLASISFFFFFP